LKTTSIIHTALLVLVVLTVASTLDSRDLLPCRVSKELQVKLALDLLLCALAAAVALSGFWRLVRGQARLA
jgi:hypothetical protein